MMIPFRFFELQNKVLQAESYPSNILWLSGCWCPVAPGLNMRQFDVSYRWAANTLRASCSLFKESPLCCRLPSPPSPPSFSSFSATPYHHPHTPSHDERGIGADLDYSLGAGRCAPPIPHCLYRASRLRHSFGLCLPADCVLYLGCVPNIKIYTAIYVRFLTATGGACLGSWHGNGALTSRGAVFAFHV